MRREAPLDIPHLAAHCCNVPVTFTLDRAEPSRATEAPARPSSRSTGCRGRHSGVRGPLFAGLCAVRAARACVFACSLFLRVRCSGVATSSRVRLAFPGLHNPDAGSIRSGENRGESERMGWRSRFGGRPLPLVMGVAVTRYLHQNRAARSNRSVDTDTLRHGAARHRWVSCTSRRLAATCRSPSR